MQTVRPGPGQTAGTARQETAVVGIRGLTTADQEGSAAHRRQANRRDFQPNLLQAVVVRQWQGRDYGPGGPTVCVTNAAVANPWQLCDDDDERRLSEHGGRKEAKQP
jgi:hypothetical protein